MAKNILFVVDERRIGGVSVLFEDMLTLLDLKKYNIDLLVLHNNGEMFENLPKSINIIYGSPYFEAVDYTIREVINQKSFSLFLKKIRLVLDMKTGHIEKVIRKERKKILTKKYDVEIAFKDGFTALFTIFGDSKKKVHWLQYEYSTSNPNQKYDKLFRRILPQFDEIVAVSDNVKKCFNEVYNLNDKVKVIYNIINQNKIIEKAKENCDIKLDKNDLNIISVGRLHPIKGYERLINVLTRLKNEQLLTNVKVRIYGDGPEFSKLTTMINENNLAENVLLMGKVLNPYKYIKYFDLFVLPSLYESFGLVMVESMTLGVPVLSTSSSATSMIIDNNINGLIVDNSNEGIYLGLKQIIENRSLIEKFKHNLIDYHYDNNEQLKQIEQILD